MKMELEEKPKVFVEIKNYSNLRVYQNALEAALKIFYLSKQFPPEEKYSMTDQIRRSSRSVCANLAEAWRKRRYKAAFIAKLNDAEGEACETQVWLDLAIRCGYLDEDKKADLNKKYEIILGQIIKVIQNADKWLIK